MDVSRLPFELTPAEEAMLRPFERRIRDAKEIIREAQDAQLEVIRRLARERGLVADDLSDLRSASGEPFVEPIDDRRQGFHEPPVIVYSITVNDEARRGGMFVSISAGECAYLCTPVFEGYGCGWVCGKPRRESYDEVGPLAGSAGTRYRCVICGLHVGTERHSMSAH